MAPATKRRKLDAHQVDAITFDPSARQEYLTGFHKRKEARKQNARDTAAKLAKEEKVQQRKQLREQRREDLVQHVADVNAELRKQNPDLSDAEPGAEVEGGAGKEEWAGIEDGMAAAAEVEQEDEYVDEDKYTTVTVEAMGGESEEDEPKPSVGPPEGADATATKGGKKRIWPKSADRPKKKKFRYESKAERQATRQHQKKKSQAARARREKAE